MGERGARFAGLTTRGRCLLAGGGATAVCAVVLDERDLLRVGVFVALLPLLALLVARRTRRTVYVERTLAPARLNVDGTTTVTLRLNGSILLGTMRLHDIVPDAAGPQTGTPPRFIVHRLTGRTGTGLDYPLRPVVRGAHRIGPAVGTATDPLGLAEFEQELGEADPLLVLPRVVTLAGQLRAPGAGDASPGSAPARSGQGASDILVRPYRHGDELRRVHWRSSARHDDLMVRTEERPWRGGTTVLLDRRDCAHRGRGTRSSMEFAVSLAASVCAHLIGRGEPVALVTEEGAVLTGPVAVPGLDPMLEALAVLRPSARTDLGGPELARTPDVLAVLGAVGPTQLQELLARRSTGGHAVLLDVATWDPEPPRGPALERPDGTAAALRRAGWRVAVARDTSTPAGIWDELAAGARVGLG